jgi:hypothetical protein
MLCIATLPPPDHIRDRLVDPLAVSDRNDQRIDTIAALEEVLQAQAAASKAGERADALAPADERGAAGEAVSLALRGHTKGDG